MPQNEIIIERTPRAYSVRFPYKPCPKAIPGFHSIGMIWLKNFSGEVRWSIPCERLNDARDFINYWYTENPVPGQPPYGIKVVEPEAVPA